MVDDSVEDILWLRIECIKTGEAVFISGCYFPPVSSSRQLDIFNKLLCLA